MGQLELIPRVEDGEIIPQRLADGYICATALCKSAGKRFSDYNTLKSTDEFIFELSLQTGLSREQLILSIRGGDIRYQGTWVHPYLAINLAQWLSPRFSVKVSQWVTEWKEGRSKAVMPAHIDRYMKNREKIPYTHFSMLNELTLNLIAPLEHAGYTLPENLVPDISEGRLFCKWLREEKGIEPKEFPTYEHEYLDGRIVDAKLYPIDIYEDFRKHFNEIWLPERAPVYFAERDPEALQFVETLLLATPKI